MAYRLLRLLHILARYSFPPAQANDVQARLGGELLLEQILKSRAVLSELFDALVELVKRHLVLKQSPAELGFVVDERDLRDRGRGS